MTPAELLRRELARDPARPLLTWYDDSSGARVELSVATSANWVAKIAGLLSDEHDVEPGVTVGIELPLHWQTACVLLAVWSCGGAVAIGAGGDVRVSEDDDADIVIEAPDPMGVALSRLVGAQPDTFVSLAPLEPTASALRVDGRGWTHTQLADAAVHAATQHGLDISSRVLTTLAYDSADGLDAGLLVPLAAGASVVLVSNPDDSLLADRCTTENVTHTAGVTIASLPRLA